jgi:hypothetical protein
VVLNGATWGGAYQWSYELIGNDPAPHEISKKQVDIVNHAHSIKTDEGQTLDGAKLTSAQVEIMPPFIVLFYCQKD